MNLSYDGLKETAQVRRVKVIFIHTEALARCCVSSRESGNRLNGINILGSARGRVYHTAARTGAINVPNPVAEVQPFGNWHTPS